MTLSKDRKEAAKNLGIALEAAYDGLVAAKGDEAIQVAAIQLGNVWNTNIDFLIWLCKEMGGVKQVPFKRGQKPRTAPMGQIPDKELPVMPEILSNHIDKTIVPAAIPCSCSPLEPGIIGSKHMASCPLAYQDA